MIFLDTSAIYAAADQRDMNHDAVLIALADLLNREEDLLVHNYVLLEASGLIQRRLGLEHALTALRSESDYRVHWLTPEDHKDAVDLLAQRGRRGLSLVDCASFVVMHRYEVTQALVLDSDFESEGFQRYPIGLSR